MVISCFNMFDDRSVILSCNYAPKMRGCVRCSSFAVLVAMATPPLASLIKKMKSKNMIRVEEKK